MTLDMYSEKVAETSALIREFAKVDYFHYFARDPESSLEAFIAMQDSAHAAGRASALAELHPQWLAEKERADRAEKNFAELSNASVALNNQHVAEQERQAERIAELESRIEFNGDHSQDGIVKRDERIAELERDAARYRFLSGNFESVYDRKSHEFNFFYNNRGELSGEANSYNEIPEFEAFIDQRIKELA